jgi:hypothetical protein
LEQMVPLGTSARFFRTDVSSVTKNLIASITYKREECWGWSLGCILQIIADSCRGVLVAGDAGTSQKASTGGAIFVSTERTIPVKHWSPAGSVQLSCLAYLFVLQQLSSLNVWGF